MHFQFSQLSTNQTSNLPVSNFYHVSILVSANCLIYSTILVPTMIHALIGLKETSGRKLEHLVSVLFGGSVLSPDALRVCINELGAKGVENAYGMTEGFSIRTQTQRDLSTIIDGEEVSIGWVSAGIRIRVADPDTNEVLPKGTLGEIQACTIAVSDYIGGVSKESFYTDEKDGSVWFKTGDQARMDDQERVFITGRYKDM
jgi:acyl-CoA synthetase (AMP-forming)/AMP-acid ligase II